MHGRDTQISLDGKARSKASPKNRQLTPHLHGGPCSAWPTPEVQSLSCLFSVPYLDEIVEQPIPSATTMMMVHEFNDARMNGQNLSLVESNRPAAKKVIVTEDGVQRFVLTRGEGRGPTHLHRAKFARLTRFTKHSSLEWWHISAHRSSNEKIYGSVCTLKSVPLLLQTLDCIHDLRNSQR